MKQIDKFINKIKKSYKRNNGEPYKLIFFFTMLVTISSYAFGFYNALKFFGIITPFALIYAIISVKNETNTKIHKE